MTGRRESVAASLAFVGGAALIAIGYLSDALSMRSAIGGWAFALLSLALVTIGWVFREGSRAFHVPRVFVSLLLLAGVVATIPNSIQDFRLPSTQADSRSAAVPSPGPTVSQAGADGSHRAAPIEVSLNSNDSCGPPAQPVILPRVELCVVNWCKGDMYGDKGIVAGQLQIKIKPRLINNALAPIAIGIGRPSALRLLVPYSRGRYAWLPPRRTMSAGDQVVPVRWNGHLYWAVPPNVPHDAYPTAVGFYSGFATVWDGTILKPESVYFRAVAYQQGRVVRRGDLVFQLPTNKTGDASFSALALIDTSNRTVLAAQPATSWPRASDPDSF